MRPPAWLLACLPLVQAAPGLYLAINALAYTEEGTVVKRRLEVNWFGAEAGPGDEIRVYDGSETLLATIPPALHPDGFYVLPGNLPYPSLEEMGYSLTCVFGLR